MNIAVSLKETNTEDYYELSINGVKLGVWERSQLRSLIEQVDNKI